MNSDLLTYLHHQVRTLLITRQVISDAKLYLKYPYKSIQFILNEVFENINDYINQTTSSVESVYRTPISSQKSLTRSKKQTSLTINNYLEEFKLNHFRSRSSTILMTFVMAKFHYLTYSMLILNFLASGAALIWLPVLATIYFWAILTFPYPSRRFWYVSTFSSMAILFIQ